MIIWDIHRDYQQKFIILLKIQSFRQLASSIHLVNPRFATSRQRTPGAREPPGERIFLFVFVYLLYNLIGIRGQRHAGVWPLTANREDSPFNDRSFMNFWRGISITSQYDDESG